MRQCVFKRRFGGYKALLCVDIKGGAAFLYQVVFVWVYGGDMYMEKATLCV